MVCGCVGAEEVEPPAVGVLKGFMYDEGRRSKCGPAPAPFLERFERQVDRSGGPEACHLWTGRLANGYGQIRVGSRADGTSRNVQATRVTWEIWYGPIPDGMFVLHNCPDGDRGDCVNVHHLWLGTHEQNMADKVAKGRQYRGGAKIPRPGLKDHPELAAHGSRNGASKLTEVQVGAIRSAHARRVFTQRELARLCGVTERCISNIIRMARWQHIA